jgi:hypothetical protein
MLAIGPKVLNPAGVDGFLRAIYICSTTSFGKEVKPGAPYIFMACKRLFHP